jgi:hypothetical protein
MVANVVTLQNWKKNDWLHHTHWELSNGTNYIIFQRFCSGNTNIKHYLIIG